MTLNGEIFPFSVLFILFSAQYFHLFNDTIIFTSSLEPKGVRLGYMGYLIMMNDDNVSCSRAPHATKDK